MATALTEVVQQLIAGGANPNDLQEEFEKAIDPILWVVCGDREWWQNMVCSKCGSWAAGICGDPGTPARWDDPKHPGLHSNQPGVQRIPYRVWLDTHPLLMGVPRASAGTGAEDRDGGLGGVRVMSRNVPCDDCGGPLTGYVRARVCPLCWELRYKGAENEGNKIGIGMILFLLIGMGLVFFLTYLSVR